MGSVGNIFSGMPTRRGHKSTEFWCMAVFVVVAVIISALRVIHADVATCACAIVIASYIFSRGKAKSKR